MNLVILLVLSISRFELIASLMLIPERGNVTYVNKKYLVFAKLYITRHGRKSPYYVNAEGENLKAWANNVTFNLYFYEYLNNEYRPSFVEFHYKVCDMMNADPYVGGLIVSQGLKCPVECNKYTLLNMTVPLANFPNTFPIKKAKIIGDFSITDTKEKIVEGYINCEFKEEIKKTQKKDKKSG